MALLPSSSSSSSITYAFTFDVFLSFRGADTRHGFTGNLFKALHDKGIHTFIDDEELQKGDEITPALEEAIENSRIAIVVLSKNYASSSFCLHELSKIMECFKENSRFVWPVFYDVDPFNVRRQTGTYGDAMTKHMERFKDNKEKLQKWRTALQQVADLSGWHYKHEDEYEHKFIEKIVEEVSKEINRVPLPIADYPVGLESQVQRIIMLLDVGSDDRVHMVGIHGIGGIGKTTLGVAVYNSIADHFEGTCFLENVRENYEKHGLLYLQKVLLLDVLGEKKITLTSEKQGVSIIQHRLRQKKVLLILDDVDKEEQLQGIVGRLDWLHLGSRVIIITRDKHLLACHGVERTYEVEGLKEEDAFKLLKWKAFKNDKVSPSYVDILNRVVTYASGLPLALEVIGSNLYGKSIQEWVSALEKYEMIPDKKIQKILEVSFEALEEEEKNVFLDIACCFKGYLFKEVKSILNVHHDQCMEYQIAVLVDKSLIKITYYNYVTLHDLIEDMGKEIVRQESPKEPGNRSRLWSRKDIFEVLEENTGTSKIEMIHLDYPSSEEVDWDGEAFKEMKKLKTLIIRKSHFSKGPKYLPNSLRVLEWWKYPLQHFPCDFRPKKLFIFKLRDSSLMSLELLSSSKKFVTMKVLNIENCQYLTHTSDLSGLENLEELSFSNCSRLITIDSSVGFLDKLKILKATGCLELKSLPSLKLPSLEELNLFFSLRIESFPEILEKMENITYLHLSCTNIKEFPSSFRNLTQLRKLFVHHLLPSRSLVIMPQVEELILVPSTQGRRTIKIEDESEEKVSSVLLSSKVERLSLILNDLSGEYLVLVPSLFPHLKELYVSGGYFTILPECIIKECRFLWKLTLYECKELREIQGIPPSLKYLHVRECRSLSFSCRSMLVKQELHEAGDTDFVLPNLERGRIPEWFEHQSRGSLSFWFRNNFPRILLSLTSAPSAYIYADRKVVLTVNGKGFHDFSTFYRGHTRLVSASMQMEESNLNVDKALFENEWNHAEFKLERDGQISLDSGIGIHVLKENSCMENILFTDPYGERKIDWSLAPLQEVELLLMEVNYAVAFFSPGIVTCHKCRGY